MHVSVNGVRLFFDVEGTKFAPPEVALHWFARPDGESDTFNMFPQHVPGHWPHPVPDAPERAMALLREFVLRALGLTSCRAFLTNAGIHLA